MCVYVCLACAFTVATANNRDFGLTDIYEIDDDGCATSRKGASCFRKYERGGFQRSRAKWRKVNHVLHEGGFESKSPLITLAHRSRSPTHPHSRLTSLQPVLEAPDKRSVDSL